MGTLTKKSIWLSVVGAACLGVACQPPTTNTTVNTAANTNSNLSVNANLMNTNVANVNSASTSSTAIETKEPEQYQATVSLKFETSGAQNLASPPIKADVARSGADRRMEFALPNGEKLIYLDRNGKQLIISPNRKQYAELTKEALGFEVRKLMLPEQIVNQVKAMKGVERVGEEKFDGREVVKYRYGATTNTQTQAGTVATESFILVDKETGLPLRSFTSSQSQNGSVQGIQGLSLVTEMSNIKTVVDASLFTEPTDYKQVAPEEIKQQVNLVFSAAMAIIGQIMKSAQPTNSPNQ
ncbi:MAG: hypothetical protein LH614_13965 [Pyrinomonadaceae bacterium]|nr:hypothetical protein [Pyrinomonadaceae bacterium]